MKIIEPSVKLIKQPTPRQIMRNLDQFARVSYLSTTKNTTPEDFIRARIQAGHESVIEHEKLTAIVITDRGVLAEITRHRIGSYTVESTRFCNYGRDKFGHEITVVKPPFFEEGSTEYTVWRNAMKDAERAYFNLLNSGAKPEEARSVLPNSLKTTICMTYNLREWRHFFKLRTAPDAHPQMRQVANMLLDEMYAYLPVIFEDIVELRSKY